MAGGARGRGRIVAPRLQPGTDAQRPGKLPGDGAQAFARRKPPAAFHMQGEIPVAKGEPGLAAELLQRRHEGPSFSPPSPAEFRVCKPGEGIKRRVQIGAYAKTEMVEVVA